MFTIYLGQNVTTLVNGAMNQVDIQWNGTQQTKWVIQFHQEFISMN